jgi:MoaA/NifB/PqqE/SkfB family radical SAM enzyme
MSRDLAAAIALWRGLATAHAAGPRLLGAGYALPPLRVALLLTHRCNLRCTMCVVPGSGISMADELEAAEIQRVLDESPRNAVITFTGGEPLLRTDLEEILRRATLSHRVHVVTNGTLLDGRWAATFVGMAAAGLRGKGVLNVGVSVHGVGALHDRVVGVDGSYSKAMAAVSELASRRSGRFPLVDVKAVMTQHNVGRLTDLYREAWQAGADVCTFQIQSNQVSSYGVPHSDRAVHLRRPPPVKGVDANLLAEEIGAMQALSSEGGPLVRFSPKISVDGILDHYRNSVKLRRHICYSTWSTLHVAPTGEVYPCFSYPMGNVRHSPLITIWNGPVYRAFRRALRSSGVFPGCVGCCVIDERRLSTGGTR